MVQENAFSYWWLTSEDDWIRVSLIAAPIMIVFGVIATISYVCHRKRSPKMIYNPCGLHANMSPYQPVYMPTTCKLSDHAHVQFVRAQDSVVMGSDSEEQVLFIQVQDSVVVESESEEHEDVISPDRELQPDRELESVPLSLT